MNKFLIILLSSPLFFELSATNIFNQGDEVLAAEKVFIINKSMDSENIIITWDIVDGYYMYLDSIKVMENKNALSYKIINSSQSKYNDDFFGESIILKKNLSIHIKKKDLSAIDSALVYYQGCSEAGFCYPVQKSYLR
jgi:thiol:disulfide interchange protein DsbD|tara:strand:- start:12777 stop:13190 length:414 start_codon:yes stop_codon:yes gene_type:complete